MFRKILVANRGEIACRVLRTARRMGLRTAAVYSDADARALHVRLADEALHIGPAPARESYLDAVHLIQAAQRCGAEAIHPGYGFLSENAAFARACEDSGIAFIGPPAEAIRAMGDKAAAKRIMASAGVPLLPGYHGSEQDPRHLLRQAEEIGYPVLLKPAAGGGGKGMRIVRQRGEFTALLESARREAEGAFGDSVMLIEKYLERPRHVEIQIFCDRHGNAVYLGERDCSVQRRHQKVIEEAPAPGMHPRLRREMGEAALRAAQAIAYVGAGTVEFLLDPDGVFHFMEMNTRLQVEHPVTEMTTGFDLVEWQLRVAAGERLPCTQEQIPLRGHAFEARIYAEDPNEDFLPQTGRLVCLEPPLENAHVRVDTGVVEGDEISVWYDPLIAKLIVWDENRARALDRLASALAEYRVGGIATNIPFLYNLAGCPAFRAGQLETGFIERHRHTLGGTPAVDRGEWALAAALYLLLYEARRPASRSAADPWSPWQARDAWRVNQPHRETLGLVLDRVPCAVEVEHLPDGGWLLEIEGRRARCEAALDGRRLVASIDGHRQTYTIVDQGAVSTLFTLTRAVTFARQRPELGESVETATASGLVAPMHGTIVRLLVEPGTPVEAGAPLIVMEAMKMEHTLRAPCAGTVTAYRCASGDLVAGGAMLVDFAPAAAPLPQEARPA